MDISDNFLEWLKLKEGKLPEPNIENLTKLYMEFIESEACSIVSSWKEMIPAVNNNYESINKGFLKKHIKLWGEGLDLLRLLLDVCINAGSKYSVTRTPKNDAITETHIQLLIKIHAKACAIANEILFLLTHGFPDAAHARWRALHETNVTLFFIAKHGPKCSEIFLEHEIYDSYYSMKSFKKYENRIQADGPSVEECELITNAFKMMVKKHGQQFDSQYGWAAAFLPKNNNRIGFKSIEKNVELDHMRPYFKWASQNIHVSTKTLTNSLSLPYYGTNILNIGPSNFGLTDPAHAMALSLAQATSRLLGIEETEENLIIQNSIKKLSDEIGEAFLSISTKIEH